MRGEPNSATAPAFIDDPVPSATLIVRTNGRAVPGEVPFPEIPTGSRR